MLNNHTKKLLKNFVYEFEGCSLQELQKNDLFIYCKILNLFAAANDLKQLNIDLYYFLKDLYLFEIKDPVKYLDY